MQRITVIFGGPTIQKHIMIYTTQLGLYLL